MANDSLIRIGKGVPGGTKPPERKLSLRATLVLAAAVLIAVVVLVVTMYNPPQAKVDQADVANSVECTTITRAYDQWWPGRDRLDTLAYVDPEVATLHLKMLTDDAKAFGGAATGYEDYPSKDLALAALDLHSQLGLLQFQQGVERTVDADLLGKAQTAWDTTGEKYRDFLAASC
jgi:hypothetical protein